MHTYLPSPPPRRDPFRASRPCLVLASDDDGDEDDRAVLAEAVSFGIGLSDWDVFPSTVDGPKRMRAWEVSCEALRDTGLASGFKLTSSVSGSTTRCWMCARWSRAEGSGCVGLPDLPSSQANFSRETTTQLNLHCMRVSQPGKSKTPLFLTRRHMQVGSKWSEQSGCRLGQHTAGLFCEPREQLRL